MATSKSDSLEAYRKYTQYFTMTAAVLAGITWSITLVVGSDKSVLNTLVAIFAGATTLGGIMMGIVYLARLTSKK